jgi:cobalt/nickel transport system permease protein
MHLPNEFLNSGAAAGLAGVAAAAISVAARTVRRAFLEKVPVLKARLATFPDFGGGSDVSFQSRLSKLGQEKMWRMAAVGSLIFSAQMVNFPIGGGTSGHLLGGVLAALILGPFEALLVMVVVLAVQAFVFGDGGVFALGANIFNMGIVGALGGYHYFRFLTKGAKDMKKAFLGSAFMAAWLSVILAAVAASCEIAVSGTKALSSVLPAMTFTHIMIGFGEGVITALVLALLMKRGYGLAVFKKGNDAYEE